MGLETDTVEGAIGTLNVAAENRLSAIAKPAAPSSEEPNYSLSGTDSVFLVVYAVIVAAVLSLSIPLTLPSLEETASSKTSELIKFLALPIYLLLFWGMWRGVIYLIVLAMERGVVSHVTSRANEYVPYVDNEEGTIAPPTFKDLELMVPFPDRHSEPVSRRMILRILRDAKDYIYDQREAVVRPYEEELGDRLHPVQALQATALRIGILGTFIGLILAITELGGMLDSSSISNSIQSTQDTWNESVAHRDLFVNFSKQLFGALHISFGTSVAGLEVSILLAFFGMYLKWSQNNLFRGMEDAAGAMMSLARRATYKEKGLLSSFAQLKAGMEHLELKIHHEMQTSSSAVEAMGERVMTQTLEIERGLATLSSVRKEWNSFLEELKTQQKDVFTETLEQRRSTEEAFNGFLAELEAREKTFLKDLSIVLDLLSVGKLGKDIRDSIAHTGKELKTSISTEVETIATRLIAAGGELKSSLTTDIAALSHGLEAVKDSHVALNTTLESLTPFLQSLSQEMDHAYERMSILDQLVTNLEATFQRAEDAQQAFQADIENSVERLYAIPLDDRLTQKIAKVTHEVTTPVNSNLSQVSSELVTLRQTASSITKSVHSLNRIFARQSFKILYNVFISVGIAAGISLIALVILGLITLVKL